MTKKTMGHKRRAESRLLTKDAILATDDLTRELVEVPEWGGAVYVQAMSGAERDAFEESVVEQKQGKKGQTSQRVILANMRAKLCARSIVDEDGERLFTNGEIDVLGRKSASALDRVFEVAKRLSGIGEEDIEELAGNSD